MAVPCLSAIVKHSALPHLEGQDFLRKIFNFFAVEETGSDINHQNEFGGTSALGMGKTHTLTADEPISFMGELDAPSSLIPKA